MKHLPLSIAALFFVVAPVATLAAPASCTPYQCMDGTQFASCNEYDTVINYFAAPCLTHGGEKSDQAFFDVPANHPNADAIGYVKSQGIVSGYADGTFKPDQQINRAEFTKILIASNYPPNFDGPGPEECLQDAYVFLDVSREWFAKYVCTAKAGGLIDGYPDGTFRPATNINFVEAAKILSKNFKLPFTDGTDSWYENYVRALSAKNAIPTSITHFDQPITRGETAEMIYRLSAGVTNKASRTYDQLSGAAVLFVQTYQILPLPSFSVKNYARNVVYRYTITAPRDKDMVITNQSFGLIGGRWSGPQLAIFSDASFTNQIDTWALDDNYGNHAENLSDMTILNGSLTIPASQTRYLELTVNIGTPADINTVTVKHPMLDQVVLSVR